MALGHPQDPADTTRPSVEEKQDRSEGPPRLTDGDRLFFRVTILLFLGVFLYVLGDGISPVLSGVLLLSLLLLGRQGVRFEVGIALVSGILFVAWFLSEISSLLWPFVISFILAYLFAPLVRLMERRISRMLSMAIISLLLLGVLTTIGVIVVPRVIREVGELVERLPDYGSRIRGYFDGLLALISRFVDHELSAEEIRQWLVKRLPEVGQIVATNITGALKGVTSGIAALLNLVMIPFVTFYVLKDYERIKRSLKRVLPRRYAESGAGFVGRVDSVLGQYVRGQILVCGFIAVLTSLGLSISGIRYSVILGIIAGVSNLIPYVGLAISLIVTSGVALLDVDPLLKLGKVILVYVVVQGLEGNFLSPRVVGRRVGLHPVWVMFALVVAAHFWGFVGMLIAIPAAAVVNVLAKIITGAYYSSRYYGRTTD